jgi:hypothetical protein
MKKVRSQASEKIHVKEKSLMLRFLMVTKMIITIKTLSERAKQAIEKRENFIYDVASETGQIVDNVAHMKWFRLAVMREIANSTKKYQHLADEIERRHE